jgi:hypothetical protein
MVIVACIGCEFRNRFATSDPHPSGDARDYVVLAVAQVQGGTRHAPVSHQCSKKGVVLHERDNNKRLEIGPSDLNRSPQAERKRNNRSMDRLVSWVMTRL